MTTRRTALKTLTGTALTLPALTESLASPMTQPDSMLRSAEGTDQSLRLQMVLQ